ncbi:structural maintenance of chromosomes protein 1A isoform X1 [Hylaeus volcanicus]|uniref:structural maintenance of chromosomes protein 1A isoform X1 n=2 Tax=Hylaeus volcanicus TaxID=313075 RepID=UPI0023B7F625|nr:structural maintenance of chromosomes protein 1A isoform X1 [Hylaeus volcanicus]
MKHQQISVDFVSMVFTACSYLALAGAVWIFLRLIQACFWLPRHLKRQNDVQRMLQDKVESYEKYILECEEKEKSEQETRGEDVKVDPVQAEKWKERRECLEMLKRELSKVRDSGDKSFDWDYLLEDEETKEDDVNITEVQGDENSKSERIDQLNADAKMTKQTVDSERKKEK